MDRRPATPDSGKPAAQAGKAPAKAVTRPRAAGISGDARWTVANDQLYAEYKSGMREAGAPYRGASVRLEQEVRDNPTVIAPTKYLVDGRWLTFSERAAFYRSHS